LRLGFFRHDEGFLQADSRAGENSILAGSGETRAVHRGEDQSRWSQNSLRGTLLICMRKRFGIGMSRTLESAVKAGKMFHVEQL
jgi:hypothetical protein